MHSYERGSRAADCRRRRAGRLQEDHQFYRSEHNAADQSDKAHAAHHCDQDDAVHWERLRCGRQDCRCALPVLLASAIVAARAAAAAVLLLRRATRVRVPRDGRRGGRELIHPVVVCDHDVRQRQGTHGAYK